MNPIETCVFCHTKPRLLWEIAEYWQGTPLYTVQTLLAVYVDQGWLTLNNGLYGAAK